MFMIIIFTEDWMQQDGILRDLGVRCDQVCELFKLK